MIVSFFIYLLKASVCLGLFYGFYFFALRKENFFQLNRAYLLITVLSSFLLPYIDLNLNLSIETLSYVGFETRILDDLPKGKAEGWGVEKILLAIYLLGVFAMIFKTVLSLFYIIYLRFTNSTIKKIDHCLVKINTSDSVFSFLNMIFWNDELDYSNDEADQILRHELVHVHQKHSLDILFLTSVNIIFWFNPIAYWYKKSMENTHEFIADFELYQKQNFQLRYVDLLMKEAKAKRSHTLSITHMFLNDQLISRLKMIKDSDKKSNKNKLLTSIPLALLMIFLFNCNGKIAASYYDNVDPFDLKSGTILQAADIDENGMINLKDGRIVTVDEFRNIVVERRKEEGAPVSKDQVYIVPKEWLKKNISYPDKENNFKNKKTK